MLFLTKKVEFSAAHRLYNPTFSDSLNEETFDKCNNYYGHGHNYHLEVTITGLPNPESGYVYDLKKIKRILEEEIISKVDHKHLNYDVEFMKGIIPTVENMVVKFWQILEDKFDKAKLYRIKLYETENSFVEYYGEPVEIKIFG